MKRSFIVFTTLFFALFATSCSSLKKEQLVNIGANDWIGYEPLFIASGQNYFKNPNIRVVEFGSTSETIKAYKNGLIEMAAVTLDEAILLKETGYKPVIVLVFDISDGGDAIVAQKEIKDFQALKGKKIGFEKTALGAYVLALALEKNKIKESDIKMEYIEFSEHEDAFLNNLVDAVVTFEPTKSSLVKKGGNIVFDSKQIPNQIVDVLVVKEEFLKANPKAVEDVLSGWKIAYEKLKNSPDDIAKISSKKYKIDESEFLKLFEGIKIPSISENRALLQNNNDSNLSKTANMLMKIMKNKALLKEEISLSGLIDDSFIKAIK
ncbi:MAG: NitT/TauT family transport system substrate-binding protein [Campylobacterota bacterium]|nr:NitT/TauT family transport system substrate-binding protein [Campylobacterota bacterium]